MSDSSRFYELKRLLRLKRHEAPPPGYFNHFSDDVVSRIRAGETGGSVTLWEKFGSAPIMGTGFLQIFQGRPGIIGGFATSLCVLLLIGIVMADRPDEATVASNLPDVAQTPSIVGPAGPSTMALATADSGGITVGSNSIHGLQAMPTLFGSQQNPLFQPVSFMQSGQ